MLQHRYFLPGLVIAGGIALSVLIITGKPRPAPVAQEAPPPPLVEVVMAQPSDVTLTVSSQGTVRPRREINIVSQVDGIVVAADENFADGGFFDAGTVLVQLEDADYRLELIRAEAQVADAAQLVAQEKGRTRQAAREWRDPGNAEANDLFLRKPQLAGAEAALAAARANVEQAKLNLARTSISVPFNGRVREKMVDVGQYVTPGTPVAQVYDTDVVEVRLPLTDRQVALLDLPLNFRAGDAPPAAAAVLLTARFADREWQWPGRVVRTEGSIDVDSRVIYAVVEVDKPFEPDPDSNRPPLSIGLFVEAEIQGRQLSQVATLPRNALRNDGTVLLVDGEDRLATRPVRVLKSARRQVWVQGLQQDDNVVISQPAVAVEGMAVTVRRADGLLGSLEQ
jgi:RND family efflux transporter MFP subunit